MDIRPEATEILAHITAPSRATDDERYRAFASAYLNFKPKSVVSLYSLANTKDSDADNISASPETGRRIETAEGFNEAQTFLSHCLSFTSVLDNLGSPGMRNNAAQVSKADEETQPSWQAPGSEVLDSCPDNKITLPQHASPTRILEHFLSGVDSSVLESSYTSSGEIIPNTLLLSPSDQGYGDDEASKTYDSQEHNSQEVQEVQERAVGAPTPTIIPRSPHLGITRDKTPRPKESYGTEDEFISSSGAYDYVDSTASQCAELTDPSLARRDSEPPPNKRLRGTPFQEVGRCLARSSSDIGPRQLQSRRRQRQQLPRRSQQSPPLISADGQEIRSPAPPVGCGLHEGGTADEASALLMTPQLAKLGLDLGVTTHFRPERQTRTLRPFERGYWLVDVSQWDDTKRSGAWTFLGNYVGNGLAGWGTWCRRDAGFTRMRMYCFGFVVAHVYFLLYLASKRELLCSGASWIGGDGEVVIVMSARQDAGSFVDGRRLRRPS